MIFILTAYEAGPSFIAQANLELSVLLNTEITSLGHHTKQDKGIEANLDEQAVSVENYVSWVIPRSCHCPVLTSKRPLPSPRTV